MFEIEQLLKRPLSQEDGTELENTLFECTQAHKQGEARLEELQVGIADLKRKSGLSLHFKLVRMVFVLVAAWFLFDLLDDLPEILIDLGRLLRRIGW